jgi:hypothetical protein
MAAGRTRLGLTLLGLLSGACAAFGYDFGEYQAADGDAGSGGESQTKDNQLKPIEVIQPSDSEAGASSSSSPLCGSAGHASQPETIGAAGAEDGSILTTYAVGGAAHGVAPEPCGDGGASGACTSASGGAGGEGTCQPRDCSEAQAQCGGLDDGCGNQLDCGACFWWFEQCIDNRCFILLN